MLHLMCVAAGKARGCVSVFVHTEVRSPVLSNTDRGCSIWSFRRHGLKEECIPFISLMGYKFRD